MRFGAGSGRRSPTVSSRQPPPPHIERAALVTIYPTSAARRAAEDSLIELDGLAAAAGARSVLRVLQERKSPDPATFLGSGKVASLAAACAEVRVDVVVVDHELTPAQLRELESRLHCRVVDRTQLILDIFARRARTREGRWQVELAQLEYLLPRLVGRGVTLSRLGGGIGTRGPGETKLETDRRRIRDRIAAIRKDLEQLRRRRAQLRERRQKRAVPTVALVGYTNAGKTTLFNRLARESAVASDALFVTLDPLVRHVTLPGGAGILLTDTVGFIERLPHALVAAFRATLEEVAEADLVVHVVDAATDGRSRMMAAVMAVLEEVGAADVPRLTVYNKLDRLSASDRTRLRREDPEAVQISATSGVGIDALLGAVSTQLGLDVVRVTVTLDPSDAKDRAVAAEVYRTSVVRNHVETAERITIEADVPRRLAQRLMRRQET
jgi:GTP-binding protein HflX